MTCNFELFYKPLCKSQPSSLSLKSLLVQRVKLVSVTLHVLIIKYVVRSPE